MDPYYNRYSHGVFLPILVYFRLALQRDFILHRIGTRSFDVTLSEAKGLATFGNEILHVVQNDMSRCSIRYPTTIGSISRDKHYILPFRTIQQSLI